MLLWISSDITRVQRSPTPAGQTLGVLIDCRWLRTARGHNPPGDRSADDGLLPQRPGILQLFADGPQSVFRKDHLIRLIELSIGGGLDLADRLFQRQLP